MAKKSVPPAFLANTKKAGGGGVGVGDKVVDPSGNKGKVVKVKGAVVHVQHDDGTVGKHPVMKIRKSAAAKKVKTK